MGGVRGMWGCEKDVELWREVNTLVIKSTNEKLVFMFNEHIVKA